MYKKLTHLFEDSHLNYELVAAWQLFLPKKNCKSNVTYILLFGPLMLLLLRLLTKLVSYFENFFPNDFRGFDDKSLVMDQKKSQVLSFIQ